MKKITCLLLAVLVLTLCSCRDGTAPAGSGGSSGVNSGGDDSGAVTYPVYRLGEHIYDGESFVLPAAETLPDGGHETAEKQYELISREFPEFSAIPKEMLKVSYFSINGYENLTYTFCFGGVETGCLYVYKTSKSHPEGEYDSTVNEFGEFFTSGITGSQMRDIRELLAAQIQEQIDRYKLENSENLAGELMCFWKYADGRYILTAEHIANLTPQTTLQSGCVDHAHLYATVYIEK